MERRCRHAAAQGTRCAGPLDAGGIALSEVSREDSRPEGGSMNWRAAEPEQWDGKTAIILAHGAGQGIDSPFMKFFHDALPKRGFLSVQFNFEYMQQRRKFPDPQPKMQALYRQVVREVAET